MGLGPAILVPAFDAEHGVGSEMVMSAAGGVTSTVWESSNRAYFFPIRFKRPGIITKLFNANGATVSGNVDIALYDESGGVPGARLVSSGGVAQAGVSALQEFDITDTPVLAMTNYFIGLVFNNATATSLAVGLASTNLIRAMGIMQQATAYPLPNPAVPVVNTTTFNVRYCGVAFRALVA